MDINRFRNIMQFSHAHGAEIADKIREFYGILGLSRSRELRNVLQMVRPVLEKKGYLIVELPFADKEIGALCYHGDVLGYVLLNSSLPRVNVNFAIAHELYHIYFREHGTRQSVELYMNEHYLEHEGEMAANLFAGMLLMPEQIFSYMYQRFLEESRSEDVELTVIAKLMNYFEVPYMAVLIRCYELKLLETGTILERLMQVDGEQIRDRFVQLWLDEELLEASERDDYHRFRNLVQSIGEKYQEAEYLNEWTVHRALQNMNALYKKIKGD